MLGFRWVVERPACGSGQLHLGAEIILRTVKEKTTLEQEYTIVLSYADAAMFNLMKGTSNLSVESRPPTPASDDTQ